MNSPVKQKTNRTRTNFFAAITREFWRWLLRHLCDKKKIILATPKQGLLLMDLYSFFFWAQKRANSAINVASADPGFCWRCCHVMGRVFALLLDFVFFFFQETFVFFAGLSFLQRQEYLVLNIFFSFWIFRPSSTKWDGPMESWMYMSSWWTQPPPPAWLTVVTGSRDSRGAWPSHWWSALVYSWRQKETQTHRLATRKKNKQKLASTCKKVRIER